MRFSSDQRPLSIGTGAQQGSTFSLTDVQVTAGIFTVQLDFSSASFTGADRFLEIAVKPTGGLTFTVLGPRQPVMSTPYSLRSATVVLADTATNATNATQLEGLRASSFVQNTTMQQEQIKQQQQEIESLRKQQQLEIESLKKRQQEFDALKSLVCANNPVAAVCN